VLSEAYLPPSSAPMELASVKLNIDRMISFRSPHLVSKFKGRGSPSIVSSSGRWEIEFSSFKFMEPGSNEETNSSRF